MPCVCAVCQKTKKIKSTTSSNQKKRKWSYGAFPHTDEGLMEAKKYLVALQKKTDEKLEIVEK